MKLQESREEIVERFRLCGELTCTLYELYDDEEDYAMAEISWDDIRDMLELDDDEEMEIAIQGEESPCLFAGVSMDDGKLYLQVVDSNGHFCLVPYIDASSRELKRVNDLMMRYVREIKKMED